MKTIIRNIFAFLSLGAMAFTACMPEGNGINYTIEPGNTLYLPADNAMTDLTKGGDTEFYWTPSVAADNAFVLYDVIFAKADGDFSNPVAVVPSQNNGLQPYLTMSAKDLNKVAKSAGIGIGQSGDLKWTVQVSKGLYPVRYTETRTLTVQTMNSIDPLPAELKIYGPALESAENGLKELNMTVSKGIDKVPASEGIFESFCKLADGQDFYIVDELGRYFVLNEGGKVSCVETETPSKISAGTSVVWLNVDLDGMVWSNNIVTDIVLYAAAWSDGMHVARTPMTYIGGGVWELLNYDNKTSDNAAFDTRHRFNATLGDGTVLYLGTEAGLGTEYTVDYRKISFFTAATVGNADWDKTFLFLKGDCGRACDVHLYLNSDNEAGTWWHWTEFK